MHRIAAGVDTTYIGWCQNDLLSVSWLSGHLLFFQESIRKQCEMTADGLKCHLSKLNTNLKLFVTKWAPTA